MSQTLEQTASKRNQLSLAYSNTQPEDIFSYVSTIIKHSNNVYQSYLEKVKKDFSEVIDGDEKVILDNTKLVQRDSLIAESILGQNIKAEELNHKDLLKLVERLSSAQKYLEVLAEDNLRLRSQLEHTHKMSMTDELTCLPNRRAYLRRLEDELSRLKREYHSLTVALIDLDHFKKVNDTFGHAAGDEVLRTFCQKVLPAFRHHDMFARYGGEEFAVVLPNTDQEGAKHALNKVKEFTHGITINYLGIVIPLNTFSAGVTMYHTGDTAKNILSRADNALYRAKKLGRNRIEIETI